MVCWSRLLVRCAQPLRGRPLSSGAANYDCDIAIVGGGVIGSSAALHLAAARGSGKGITVFERDSTYARASAPRSAGGIRQQFSLPANIELSLYGIEFLKTGLKELCKDVDVDPDVQFRENGYLLLAGSGNGTIVLRENQKIQHDTGATWISLLEPPQLYERFPWLSKQAGLTVGAFGERNEGYFDPWALLQAMRKCAIARGVNFVGAEVAGFEPWNGSDRSIRYLELADGSKHSVGTVVNAAGAFGGDLVRMCGPLVASLPVEPRKRSMFLFRLGSASGEAVNPPNNTPLTIFPNGVYFRSEGGAGRFVCGVSPKEEDDTVAGLESLECADHDLFENNIWPTLAEYVPSLENLKVESSWAGLYEYNTLDQNGVVDWHPDVPNLLIACGFSGHGLQQSPAVGRAVTELIMDGCFKTVDLKVAVGPRHGLKSFFEPLPSHEAIASLLTVLGFGRILRNEPVYERGIY